MLFRSGTVHCSSPLNTSLYRQHSHSSREQLADKHKHTHTHADSCPLFCGVFEDLSIPKCMLVNSPGSPAESQRKQPEHATLHQQHTAHTTLTLNIQPACMAPWTPLPHTHTHTHTHTQSWTHANTYCTNTHTHMPSVIQVFLYFV